jgi:hypothetical protein
MAPTENGGAIAASVVRREEEDNAKAADDEARDFQENADLPGNNEAADRAEEHQANADARAAAGADYGYTNAEEET